MKQLSGKQLICSVWQVLSSLILPSCESESPRKCLVVETRSQQTKGKGLVGSPHILPCFPAALPGSLSAMPNNVGNAGLFPWKGCSSAPNRCYRVHFAQSCDALLVNPES